MEKLNDEDVPKLYIRHMAKEVGVHPNTIRKYEKLGYIKPKRDPNGYRRYSLKQARFLRDLFNLRLQA